MTITLTLPYPPSTNRLWVRAKKGMRRSDEYMTWLNEAGWLAKAQRPGSISGPYSMRIHATRPDRRRRDLDNIFKSVGDFLQHIGIIEDDSLCQSLSACWVTSGEGVTVILEKVGMIEAAA